MYLLEDLLEDTPPASGAKKKNATASSGHDRISTGNKGVEDTHVVEQRTHI